jgi:hypothetical protein
LRALIKEQWSTNKTALPEGYGNWMEVVTKETQYNSRTPFADALPCIVAGLTPVSFNNEWWLQDGQYNMMPLAKNYGALWMLLSISGGEALTMSLIGKENEYEPVGVWYNNEYKSL